MQDAHLQLINHLPRPDQVDAEELSLLIAKLADNAERAARAFQQA